MKSSLSIRIVYLFAFLASCQKKEDTAPTVSTPQQLLLGTWKQIKYVNLQKGLNGRVILKDSITYAVPDAASGITFKADGTTYSPLATTADYIFAPPIITYYSYNGYKMGANTVIKLTAQELIVQSKMETNTSVITESHFYVK